MTIESEATRTRTRAGAVVGGVLALLAGGCGSSGSTSNDGGGGTGGGADGGGGLRAFVVPAADPGPKTVLFTTSGEELAFTGYSFPPAADGDAAFVDGWEIRFDRLLVTIDKITLSENPNMVPTDQSKTGKLVAEVDGPWAVDLHKQGPLPGMGGGLETAVPIAALTNQNKNGGAAFDTAGGTMYAFGFDLVAAAGNAVNVNLDDAAKADYQQMVTDGCVVLYSGTATFKGTGCTPADPEFARLPTTVKYRLCFKSPSSYANCQDGSNPGTPLDGEEHPRGFAFKDNESVTAQVTVHTDHPFWESTVHDSPAHFDQLAARLVGVTGTTTVTLQDVVGVDYTAFTDKAGTALPWRTCLPLSMFPNGGYDAPAGQMHFDAQAISKTTDPATGFRDYADFATYNQSTQGHLNSDGLCAVARHYPSPQ